MPTDTPQPLDTPTLVELLKHQLRVDYVILAGYLKVGRIVLLRMNAGHLSCSNAALCLTCLLLLNVSVMLLISYFNLQWV